MKEKEILKRIDKMQHEIKEQEIAIKFFRKEIWKNKDRLGVLKLDCKRLIKAIDSITDLRYNLIELYRKQNEIGRATHKAIEKHLGIRG